MIQRVQSIYLLLVTVLMSLLLIWPYAGIEVTDARLLLFKIQSISFVTSPAGGPEVYKNTIHLAVQVVATCLISFITIFLFNRRKLQIRLTLFNILLIVIIIASMLYYTFAVRNVPDYNNGNFQFRFVIILPVLSVLLNLMAIRFIRKDEFLVKSYDRIR